MTANLLRVIILAGSAIVGGGIGVVSSTKENSNKDKLIEDLAGRYNELVESINDGTIDLDAMEDVGTDENDDEEDGEVELRLESSLPEVPEDAPELDYYPGAFIDDCNGASNRVQILYTDIENCNDGEIELAEDILLDDVNAAIAMICTAYQSAYIDGLAHYINVLTDKVNAIKRLRNYDSSIKENKALLIKDINIVIEKANQLNSKLQLNREKQMTDTSDDDNDSEDNFVVPVYHKKGIS